VEERLPAERPPAVSALHPGELGPAPGLVALACGPRACAWLGPDGVTILRAGALDPAASAIPLPFPADRLAVDGDGFVVGGACDSQDRCRVRLLPGDDGWRSEPPAPDPGSAPPLPATPEGVAPVLDTAMELARWAAILGHGRRIPFERSVPVAGGGLVTYRRVLGLGGGVLTRIGHGIVSVDAPSPSTPISCEGWLAPHPGGQEVYLLLWPRPELAAYEAQRLGQRWSLPLPGPAQGLFLDPAGRFALLSETGPAGGERLLDHPALPLPGESAEEPLLGAAVFPPDAPAPIATLLVDLGGPAVAARVEGAFRAWQQAPDGAWLLATNQAILRLTAP